MRNACAFARIAIALGIAEMVAQAQWKTAWSYAGATGPAHWAELDPEYAACRGAAQSPIDIREAVKDGAPEIRLEYRSAPLEFLINNGRAIRVNYHGPANASFLVVGEERYQLTQFHFHHPSEEYVHGKASAMSIHFMHEAGDGKLAAVAVLLKVGKANPAIGPIWEHMPPAEGKEQEVPGAVVNPAGLLPADLGYYEYSGSLTGPPCTEGVRWFVMKTPVEISAEQVRAYAKLYPHNVRPVQSGNGRVVRER